MWQMLIGPIAGVVTSVIGKIAEARAHRRTIKEQQRLAEIEVEKRKVELAKEKGVYDSKHALESLKVHNADKLLRRVILAVMTTPYILAAFKPELVQGYFDTIRSVIPDEYHLLFLGGVAIVLGVKELRGYVKK